MRCTSLGTFCDRIGQAFVLSVCVFPFCVVRRMRDVILSRKTNASVDSVSRANAQRVQDIEVGDPIGRTWNLDEYDVKTVDYALGYSCHMRSRNPQLHDQTLCSR